MGCYRAWEYIESGEGGGGDDQSVRVSCVRALSHPYNHKRGKSEE